MKEFIVVSVLLVSLALVTPSFGQEPKLAATRAFIDYFLPMPITESLSKNVWGAPEVGPRDPKNGLEDVTVKHWYYWDGQIIKGPDGRYHMFASRWDQARGHSGWTESKAIHAVSDRLIGPYVDKGLCWPDSQGGTGHNVTALVLPDGRYAVVISETRPGTIFVSKSLDGPWEKLGTIKGKGLRASNISLMVRPDGDYMIVPRSGHVFISKAADGILGPYQDVGSSFPRASPISKTPVSSTPAASITSSSTPGVPAKPTTSPPKTARATGSSVAWPTTRQRISSATPMALSIIGTSWNVPVYSWKTAM